MSVAFVARQPIFDRRNRLVGYELLYRESLTATTAGVSRENGPDADALRMTGSTMVTSVLSIGLDSLTGGSPAWINFSRELLLHRDFELLDPHRCVIELLESVVCDDEAVAACRALREKGYTLALDDFEGRDDYAPLLELAQIVKLSVLDYSPEALTELVDRLQQRGLTLLAEKVEDRATYERCHALGFSYFQGFYFSRPEVVQRRELPVELTGVARLMNLTIDSRASDRELELAFRGDPALSLQLLRIVNAAVHGGRGVESILHALRLVGRAELHRWLALLLVKTAPAKSHVERELVLTAIERARFCEAIALGVGDRHGAPSLFLAGLLSSMAGALGVTVDEFLTRITVSDDVACAIRGVEGPLTPILALATAYAQGDWDAALPYAEALDVLFELPEWYAESGRWARSLLSRS
jgi:EAL and modified HD-GYP domain-containing signal transduction protein